MEFTAQAIAEFLKGEVEGNPEVKVNNVAKIEEATPGTLAFLANPKYAKYLYTTNASIVLINKDYELEKAVETTLIRVENAYESFAKLLELADQARSVKQGISSLAFIDESAKIGDGVYIAPFVYIGENAVIEDNVSLNPHVFIDDNVTVKKNSILNSGVKVYHECVVGENCIIHAGAVIGSDGFGFAPDENNVYRKIPQLGNVVVEDNVEIGSNTTIDRATMGSTYIRKGAKLNETLEHFQYYLEYTKSVNTLLVIKTCPLRQNIFHIPELIKYFNKYDIPIILNNVFFPPSCTVWNLSSKKLHKIVEFLNSKLENGNTKQQKDNWSRYKNLINQISNWEKEALQREKENRYSQETSSDLLQLLKKNITDYIEIN